jgi:dihydroflavonol-4-reductase
VRVLVTGATGFLGTHLVNELLAAGQQVVALCRQPAPALTELGVTVVRGDVLEPASIAAAAAGCERVFHAAGFVSRKPEHAEELYAVHVAGTRNVLTACRAAGVRKAVVASTSGVVAVSADPTFIATEDSETPIDLLQRWPYYRAKLFAERAAFALASPTFDVVCINPTLLLGPGDKLGSSTEDVKRFLERKLPAVPPGGLSFVDVRDAAIAMRVAADLGRSGERYLLAACNLTVREFFGRLARVSGVAAPVLPMPRAPGLTRAGLTWLSARLDRAGIQLPVDVTSVDLGQYFWYLDASKAERELGWNPRDPQQTLHETVRDLRARGVVWPALHEAHA